MMTLILTWKVIVILMIMTFMTSDTTTMILPKQEGFVSAFTATIVRKPLLDWRHATTINSKNLPRWSCSTSPTTTTTTSTLYSCRSRHDNDDGIGHKTGDWRRWMTATTFGFMMMILSSVSPSVAYADTTTTTVTTPTPSSTISTTSKNYDGFAEYAKENQMEQSDVACFINQCGAQTKELFRNPRGIKGIVCLGKCKGEQSCATRCFAQYSSPALNDWLSCTIEEEGCVKVPKKAIDNSAEQLGYPTALKKFDPSTLVGTWYKTDGLNPNYDLFDCQTNTFRPTTTTTAGNNNNKKNIKELDMDIFFRVQRPIENGGGYWENQLTEHMIVDQESSITDTTAAASTTPDSSDNEMDTTGRTMHTSGKMYGLEFYENWYILGESDGTTNADIPPFKLVAYKGHTLQGNYEGAFVYAKEPTLPIAAIPAVEAAAQRAGLNFKDFTKIDNACPTTEGPLNDELAGTGTSTMDWFDLITGEGGVIDWISPGWRGEYSAKK